MPRTLWEWKLKYIDQMGLDILIFLWMKGKNLPYNKSYVVSYKYMLMAFHQARQTWIGISMDQSPLNRYYVVGLKTG